MKKICVIGGGRWGENHIRTLHEMGNLGAVVDLNAPRLQELKTKYGMETFTDLDEAIARGYDGYVVATSAETHYAIGKKLLELGLPTLIEKPMTLHIEESLELVEIAECTGANFMVAHILLFHPAINKIKELIDSGAIGDVYYMYSTRIKFGVVRTEENVFESFAPHDLATLNYFAGVPAESMTLHRGYFLQKDICDYVLAYLEYPNNVKAHIQVSWLHPFKEQRVVVVGSKGMIWFDDAGDKQVRLCNKHVEWIDGVPTCQETESDVVPVDYSQMPLERELRYFVAHTDKKPEYSTGADGYALVRALAESRK
jgi:UDP-2-acetamido-3-amino-2,3-dideoxy-glucuronate N-acetyltransferase